MLISRSLVVPANVTLRQVKIYGIAGYQLITLIFSSACRGTAIPRYRDRAFLCRVSSHVQRSRRFWSSTSRCRVPPRRVPPRQSIADLRGESCKRDREKERERVRKGVRGKEREKDPAMVKLGVADAETGISFLTCGFEVLICGRRLSLTLSNCL